MNVEILTKKENLPLERKELLLEVSFSGATPKREELKAAVVAKLGSQPELTVIKKAEQLTGKKTVRVTVFAYTNPDTLKRVEPEYVLKREGLIKEGGKEGEGEKKG